MLVPPVHDLARPLEGLGYQFWSGFEGALQAASEHIVYFVVAVSLWLVKHNCHEHRCLRLSWHPDEDGHPVCKVHSTDHPARGWFRSDRRHPRHAKSKGKG